MSWAEFPRLAIDCTARGIKNACEIHPIRLFATQDCVKLLEEGKLTFIANFLMFTIAAMLSSLSGKHKERPI
jgi:hypothetical protein